VYPFARPDLRFRIFYWSRQAYNAHGGEVINPLTPLLKTSFIEPFKLPNDL